MITSRFKCDRCGDAEEIKKEYLTMTGRPVPPKGWMRVQCGKPEDSAMLAYRELELCPKCAGMFERFLDQETPRT